MSVKQYGILTCQIKFVKRKITKQNKIMLLRRLGNKQIIAKEIIKYFPEHDIYIDFFLEQEEYFLINNK